MRKSAWLIGSFVLLTPALASAANYVVAPNGDDAYAGDAANPWATLQHAADVVVAGDTVTVEAGDYKGFNLVTSGTQGAPITFSAKLGVNITSENDQTNLDGINIEDTENGNVIAYVIVEGFTVNGMARAGIRCAVSSHVTIRKNKMDQNQVWGILTGFADDIVIEDNECSRSVEQHGIYFGNSADRPIIRRNLVWGNSDNGIHMNGDVSLGGDGIISDALVEANILYGNGMGGGSGINCDGVQDSRIQNNLIYDTHASGISLYMIDGAEPAKNNIVVNNTILVASDGRWALNIQDGSTGNHLYNNILWNAHPSRGSIDIAADALPGFVSNNNVMLGRFTTDDSNTILDLEGWQSATGQDAASSAADPLFVTPGASDYHVQSASPAVDKGTATEAPASDLEGTARPQGAAIDIGAYELCPGGDCQPGTGGTGGGGTGGGATGGNGAGGNGAGGTAAGGNGTGGAGGEVGYCGPNLTTCGTDYDPGCGCRTAATAPAPGGGGGGGGGRGGRGREEGGGADAGSAEKTTRRPRRARRPEAWRGAQHSAAVARWECGANIGAIHWDRVEVSGERVEGGKRRLRGRKASHRTGILGIVVTGVRRRGAKARRAG